MKFQFQNQKFQKKNFHPHQLQPPSTSVNSAPSHSSGSGGGSGSSSSSSLSSSSGSSAGKDQQGASAITTGGGSSTAVRPPTAAKPVTVKPEAPKSPPSPPPTAPPPPPQQSSSKGDGGAAAIEGVMNLLDSLGLKEAATSLVTNISSSEKAQQLIAQAGPLAIQAQRVAKNVYEKLPSKEVVKKKATETAIKVKDKSVETFDTSLTKTNSWLDAFSSFTSSLAGRMTGKNQ